MITQNQIKLPSLDFLKRQAKVLRSEIDTENNPVSHSKTLELLAHQYGYRDWNSLHAAVGNQGPGVPVSPGDRVSGTYLGQPFTGKVKGVRIQNPGNRYRVTFVFDKAVDVVTFDGLSCFRKQVTATIGEDGKTAERTSNGLPQLALNLAG